MLQEVFFAFGAKRRICPREWGKKIKLKKMVCFGLGRFCVSSDPWGCERALFNGML